MRKDEIKHYLRKTWKFIWEEDSAASWLVNIVLAFVLIKFIVYPTLRFLLQTAFPIVAVVSGSMEHKVTLDSTSNYKYCGVSFEEKENADFWETCGEWYEQNTVINEQDFKDFPFSNGFNKGDIMILRGKKPRNINIGDVIVFQSGRPDPIIHRVIDIRDGYYFTTKGDHNARVISEHPIKEDNIAEDQVLGNAFIRIPLLGYIKIWFVELIQLLIR
jgi:signal peptidase I